MLSDSKPTEANFSTISIDLLRLQHDQIPINLEIRDFCGQTDYFTPRLAHARGVIRLKLRIQRVACKLTCSDPSEVQKGHKHHNNNAYLQGHQVRRFE